MLFTFCLLIKAAARTAKSRWSGSGADVVEFLLNLLGGRSRQQGNHYDTQAGEKERGQELIDIPYACLLYTSRRGDVP